MAIKASELRIGNTIYIGGNTLSTYQTYKPYTVTVDIIKEIAEENQERPDAVLSVFQPIPLTLSILEACGFEKSKFNNEWQWDKKVVGCNNGFFDFNERWDGTFYFWTQIKTVEFKYLHQLQNFFYITTQTELEYKPPTPFPNNLDEIEPSLETLMLNKQKENK